MSISLLIHRLHNCLTKTVDMTLFLAPISLTNLASLSNITTISDHEIPLKNPNGFFNNNIFVNLNNELCLNKEDNMFDQELLDNNDTQILDAKYEQVDNNRVAANQKHLHINRHHELQHLFAKNKKLFDGSRGVYPHQKV